MNIAFIAPLVSPIAEPFIGGAQSFMHDLGIALARRGHTISLFGATGSHFDTSNESLTTIKRLRVIEIPVKPGEYEPATFTGAAISPKPDPAFYHQAAKFQQIFIEINQAHVPFDIAHSQAFDWPVFAFSTFSAVPTVHTLQLPNVNPAITRLLQNATSRHGLAGAVTVSQACARTYPEVRFDRVIYNAVRADRIPFSDTSEGFLLFAGRISPEKRPDLAIEIAKRSGKRLIIVGGIYSQSYFDAEIAPQLEGNSNIKYLGRLPRPELYSLMGQADCLLFTSEWEEPFGIVLAEALACGTPAISWRRGAAPEIIEDSVTGFLLSFGDIEGAVTAVTQATQLDRHTCRNQIVGKFSLELIAQAYEEYYQEILAPPLPSSSLLSLINPSNPASVPGSFSLSEVLEPV